MSDIVPTPVIPFKEVIYASGLALGWIVTGIGWLISNKHANSRESRKEIRARVDSLTSSLNELVKAACAYYTERDVNQQPRKALDIHILIEDCRRKIERLEQNDDAPSQLNIKFQELFEAVTGGDFESSQRLVGPQDNEKCRRIALVSGKTIDCLESWYKSKF